MINTKLNSQPTILGKTSISLSKIYLVVVVVFFAGSLSAETSGKIGNVSVSLFKKLTSDNLSHVSTANIPNENGQVLQLYCQHDKDDCFFNLYYVSECEDQNSEMVIARTTTRDFEIDAFCSKVKDDAMALTFDRVSDIKNILLAISDNESITFIQRREVGISYKFYFLGLTKVSVSAVLGYHDYVNGDNDSAYYTEDLELMDSYPQWTSSDDCINQNLGEASSIIRYFADGLNIKQKSEFELRMEGKLDGWLVAALEFVRTNMILKDDNFVRSSKLTCAISLARLNADVFFYNHPHGKSYKDEYNRIRNNKQELCDLFDGIAQLDC